MSDPTKPPPRGRPRVPEPGSTVQTWMPTAYHERLVTLARERNVKVSTLIRELLTLPAVKPRDPGK